MQLVYALVFQGSSAADPNGTVFRGSTSAPSCTVTTVIAPGEVITTLQEVRGETAALSSTIIETGPASFVESGTITFGRSGENVLYFSTVGQGTIGGEPAGTMRGAVIWQVNGGTGLFKGATGLITSNFSITDDLVTDHHWGVITLA
jgi:hypothetical protein